MPRKTKSAGAAPLSPSGFTEILSMIEAARHRAYQAVNTELVSLYWQIGQHISRKIAAAEWGDKVVAQLADYLAKTQPRLKGFTKSNLFRMKQFYEVYAAHEIVAALPRQLSWTHNLLIMTCKHPEEREFYLRAAIRERWSSRELERQIDSGLFLRAVAKPAIVSPLARQIHPALGSIFKDSYSLEFLGLADSHTEPDLHAALIRNLGRFLTELGHDFCFVGSQYPLQVGGQDFVLDLLFFHRGLNCLVAIELKATRFKPEHLGQLNFYLEALDRDHRKTHENPAIGLLLCATKDDEVVEYSLSRSLSPTLIAEYQTRLPDKRLLQAKLHELYQLLATSDEDAP